MKKLIQTLKEAGTCFTLGAGVVTILISVVTAFVAVPLFVTFVAAGTVGLICAVVGGYHESRRLQKEANKEEKLAAKQDQAYLDLRKQLDEIKSNLEQHHDYIDIELGHNNYPLLDQAQSGVDRVHVHVTRLCEVKNTPMRNNFYLFSPQTSLNPTYLEEQMQAPANELVFIESTDQAVQQKKIGM